MKILVTGARGFLGKFLCKRLELEGHTVYPVLSSQCDLTKPGSLNCFKETAFDQIYHLAAWTQAGDFCLHHPGDQFLINQMINTNVLSWWHEKQPQAKLIAMGTSCGYAPENPLEEAYYLQGLPIDSLFTYGMTKRMLLVGLMALHKQYGHNYLYLIPSTLYGPDYHTDGRQMHFIFDLIAKILRGKNQGAPVTLWGDGHQKRELVHVEDFVSTLLHLSKICENTIVNIGAGVEYSIRECTNLICSQVGFPFENIDFDLTKYVGARSKVLSIARLKELHPTYSPRSLPEGLQETISWFAKKLA